MELRQLKSFLRVAETLNFSEAAKSLCMTQSTLSQQIKQLEADLDVQLLIRTSHNVALTEAGTELIRFARQAIDSAELCRTRINDLKTVRCGKLNIGVTYSFSSILTETLVTFMKCFPNVRLNIYYRPMSELMEMLRSRTVDFVLAFRPNDLMTDINSRVLFQSHLSAIVGDGHPLASQDKVTLSQLSSYHFAMPAKGLQARNAFDKIAHHYGLNLNIRIELNEVDILLKLIRQNRLVTILAETSADSEAGIKAIPIDTPENEMAGCVHTLKDSYHKKSMYEFLDLLSESVAVRKRVEAWL